MGKIRSKADTTSLRDLASRSYAEAGFKLRPLPESFGAGGVLTGSLDVLWDELRGKAFSGAGPFPQTVPKGSSSSVGGFVDRSGHLLRALATVAEIASGVFPVGKVLSVTDRGGAAFTVVSGGTPNGFDRISAGSGKTATLAGFNVLNGTHLGVASISSKLCSSYVGSMLPFIRSTIRTGIRIDKTLSGFSFKVAVRQFIGSGSVKLYISAAGGGTGASVKSPISFDGLQTKIAAGEFNNIGSLHLYLTDRIYGRHTSFTDFGQIPCRLYVKSLCGGSWLTCRENTTWTTSSPDDPVFSGSYPNSNYTITNLFNLDDLDADGIPAPYTFVASIEEFNAASERVWWQSGADIKVKVPIQTPRTAVSLIPVREIEKYNPNATNFAVFEDIMFAVNGGCYQNKVTSAWVVYDNCLFYGGKFDSVGIASDKAKCIYNRCIAAYPGKDGFNYHSYNALAADDTIAIEINCLSVGAGLIKYRGGNTTTQSNNASTAHDGLSVYRFGGEYCNSEGPVLADIQGCRTINIGCSVGSDAVTNSGASSGFLTYASGNKPWAPDEAVLIDVVFKGAFRSKVVDVSGSGSFQFQNLAANSVSLSSTLRVKEIVNGY